MTIMDSEKVLFTCACGCGLSRLGSPLAKYYDKKHKFRDAKRRFDARKAAEEGRTRKRRIAA